MRMMSILDQREGEPDRRHAVDHVESGKSGEWIRWGVSLILAALVAYGTVQAQLSAIEATNNARFDEIQRSLSRIERWMERREDIGR